MLTVMAASKGIWTDTVGLAFTFFILLPALATGLIIVAKVSAKGEKDVDDKMRGRWGKRRGGPLD